MNNFKKNIYRTNTIEGDIVINYFHRFSPGVSDSPTACSAVSYPVVFFTSDPTLINGIQLYRDGGLSFLADGDDLIYKSQDLNQSVQISNSGIMTILTSC